MFPAPIPPDEAARIATLRQLLVLDTAPEGRYDAITAYAAITFGVPIALVSLVDTERQWFKSAYGLTVEQTSREVSFCAHAVLKDEILEISDARQDDAFHDNPLVTEAPFIRFYAGAPLAMANGQHIGTLCIIDSKPKRLSDWEREHLKTLARMVAAEIQAQPGAAVDRAIRLAAPVANA